jgi:uncharacterized protein (DUF885 family)
MKKPGPSSLATSCLVAVALSLQACGRVDPPAEPVTESATLQESAEEATSDFDSRIADITRDYFALRPEIATYYGVPDDLAGIGISGRLTDYSVQGEADRRAGLQALIDKLYEIDRSTLTGRESTSLEMIATEARFALAPSEVADYGFVLGAYGIWFYPYVVSHMTGPHVEIPDTLNDKMTVRTSADAAAYLGRLDLYAGALDGAAARMWSDMQLGVVPPDFIIDRTIANLSSDIEVPAAEHPLAAGFGSKLDAANLDRGELVARATATMQDRIYPAIRRLIDALTELRQHATHEAGVGRLPDGASFYQAMISQMTDTTLKAEEIHAIGLSEVDRIHAEMDVLLRQIGYSEGTVGERMSVMLADPQYIYPNTDEGKARLMSDLKSDLALADARLPQWFGRLPEEEVVIREVPAHRAAATSGAFYDAPSLDGSRPATYWIALADTATLPSYSLQTLTYHEANPGHHLQVMLGLDDALPLLSTVLYSNAATEGWALYAERLAKEMGIYENDPVDDIGRLQAELHRAVRLVVDTGMHTKGWSREQSIEYSVATEGIHPDEARGEIERYVVWPGQALGYKLGMLKILELRQRAKERLGSRFDIRAFHDRLLENGALPLNMMATRMDAWIAGQSVSPDSEQ